MNFTKAEEQLLRVIYLLTVMKKQPVNKETLEKIREEDTDQELEDWAPAFNSLSEKALLNEKEGIFSLTKKAKPIAKKITKEYAGKGSSDGKT